MAISGIQSTPPPATTPQQNPVQQVVQRKVDDHDGDASDLRIEQKAALTNGGASRLLNVKV
jgi:hypothetical protein